ncbi:MAG TPA: hypothetical protein VFA84_00290 [Acidimicrobiales bacterium]|nr:hypothetical protein [Acidimicrobiales bacterium]
MAGLLAGVPLASPAAAAAPGAYWLVASDGGIFTFGVPFYGSAGAIRLNQPIVAMAATPDGAGYWLVARDGGIFTYGDARYFGALPGVPGRPSAAVIGMTPTPDGGGYWIATADGGVYTFGDAPFFGSRAGRHSAAPFVSMAVTPDGGGYWLVGADGSVYTFGDAPYLGGANQRALAAPIVGAAANPTGPGYWLVASDGGVFAYGTSGFFGSTGSIKLNRPIVSMAASPDGGGYWLVASDGGIFAFGDASFRGSTGAHKLNAPIVGIAVGHPIDPFVPGTFGNDVSFPQCGATLPAPGQFAIVGINGGKAFTTDPCFQTLAAWAGAVLSIYMNINAPPQGAPQGLTGPAGQCQGNDTGCMAYNYGYNAAASSLQSASSMGVSSGVWWIDVETANHWDTNQFNNARTIQGALDALTQGGVIAGIYSTGYQFGLIAGAYAPATPVWVATGDGQQTAIEYCSPVHAFGGGTPWLTQFGTPGVPIDQDYACPSTFSAFEGHLLTAPYDHQVWGAFS